MRVDFVTKEYPPNIYGGAGVHITELVAEMRKLVTARVHAFGEITREQDSVGYPTPAGFEQENPALQTLATDLSIVRSIAGADLVHSHTWYANFAGHLAGLLHTIPHIVTAHSLEPLRPWKAQQLGGGYQVSSFIERSAYEGAARIIAVSEGMRTDILRAYPDLDQSKIEVVYNGIDTEKWHPVSEPDTLRELGINPDARSVVFVGRITKQKGLPYLLKAARDLPGDVELILCAGAPDTPEIAAEVEALVDELKAVRGNVIWIREHLAQPRLRAVLSHASVFACPSIYEPLGIVNLEAMACEAAVVATATGGIPEVVADGETGWLVTIEQLQDGSGTPVNEARFVADWASALAAALASGELEQRGKAGRERAKQFSWSAIATRTLEVYKLALAN
jgi:alpha-maltose-1-phosphate synthase